LTQELIYKKQHDEDIVVDQLSISDYITSAAYFVVREAEGPNILSDITYGRVDAKNETEAGDVKQIPVVGSSWVSNLKAKGFENGEIVALASVEAFGVVWDPKKLDTSKYPKLDNYYYKQLLTGSNVLLQKELTSDADLKTIVEKYAQDQKAFHESFGSAFIKLSNLGQAEEELTNVENLLEVHPYKKFIDVYY
jgi:catalase (peroxidase I)